MNKIVILICSAALAGCSAVKVDAGQEAVLIQKPMFFGSGGVVDTPVRTGRTYVAPTTDWVIVDKRPIQQKVEFADLMSSNGIPLDFDSTLAFQITDSVRLIRDFGPNWYANNLESQYSTFVRQAVRKYDMNSIVMNANNSNAVEKIDAEVTARLGQYIAQAKLPIRLLRVTVGRANPPSEILTQRIKTAEQEQRIQTETQTKLAEEQRKGAEAARAEADAAYQTKMSLNSEQYVELQRIGMLKEVCGNKNCTFITGGNGAIIDTRR